MGKIQLLVSSLMLDVSRLILNFNQSEHIISEKWNFLVTLALNFVRGSITIHLVSSLTGFDSVALCQCTMTAYFLVMVESNWVKLETSSSYKVSSQSHKETSLLMHSDWLKYKMRLVSSNQSGWFQSIIFTLKLLHEILS